MLKQIGQFLHPRDIELGKAARALVHGAGPCSFAWIPAEGTIDDNGYQYEFQATIYGLGSLGVFLAINRGPHPAIYYGPAQPEIDLADPYAPDTSDFKDVLSSRAAALITNNAPLATRSDVLALQVTQEVSWAEQSQPVLVMRDPDSDEVTFDFTCGANYRVTDLGLLVICLIGLGLGGE